MTLESLAYVTRLGPDFYLLEGPYGGRFPYCNAFLFTGGQTALIDTGIGEERIREIDGIKRIDLVLFSHPHSDHISYWHALADRHLLYPQEMPDDVYDITAGQLKFENNCYFNPHTAVRFSIGAGFNYKDGYRKGSTYSLREWQTEYGYDADSVEADPLFVDASRGDFRLRADSPCGNLGRYGRPDGVPLSVDR